MGWIKDQFSSVVEWNEFRDDMVFYKWPQNEIKKGSRLIIRQGQDAIFYSQGKIEGIFQDEGEYDIESKIIPVLSTLKGFKFGFNSGMRCEVLFVNTKQFQGKWGTKNAINIPAPQYGPGGMPIRAFGTYDFSAMDYVKLIDNITGVKAQVTQEDLQGRVSNVIDQLLMKWIVKEGKDMFNLQANSFDISNGIKDDLNTEIADTGLEIKKFVIQSFTYPESVQKMIEKNAGNAMIGDVTKYTQINMADSMMQGGNNTAGSTASSMAQMMMGMQMANQMMGNMNVNGNNAAAPAANAAPAPDASVPVTPGAKFCPNCGQKLNGEKFCPNCGQKLI